MELQTFSTLYSTTTNSSPEELIENSNITDPLPSNDMDTLMLGFQIYGYAVGILGLIGIPANMVSLFVFAKARDRTSTNFLLQVLAIADSLFLFWSMFIWTGFAFNVTSEEGVVYYFNLFKYALPLIKGINEFSRDFAIWMVVLVTLDRFTAIYFPLRASTMSRLPLVKGATVLILFLALGINIPRFTHIRFDGSSNVSLRSSDFAYGVVYFAVDAILVHFLPMVLVCAMNAGIIRALREATRRRVVATRCDNERESCTTSTLAAIATIFVVCELPKTLHIIIEICIYIMYDRENRNFGNVGFLLYTLVANIFQIFNSFVNFFIYCLIAKRFRMALKLLIRNAKLTAKSMVFRNNKSTTESYGL